MGADLNTFDKVLKEWYLGPVRTQFNNRTILANRLQKSSNIREGIGGLEAYIPLHTGRNGGVGARATSGATLPTAGNQQYKNAVFGITAQYGRMQVEGTVIAMSKKDKGSFIRAIKSEMKGLSRDVTHNMNRQILGDGSGVVTACGVTSNSTTVNVDKALHLGVGQVIDILTMSNGSSVASGRTITAVDTANNTITISGAAVTTAATEGIYVDGSRILEINGIDFIIDDANSSRGVSNFGGIDRTAAGYDFWKAQVLSDPNSADRKLEPRLMQDAFIELELKGSSENDISVIITNPYIKAEYGDFLIADKRYEGKRGKLDAGYTGLSYQGKEILTDKHCKDNTMYFVCEDDLVLFDAGNDWDWMDMDGNVLSRVTDKDAYEATIFRYFQLGAYRCNSHAKLEHIDHG